MTRRTLAATSAAVTATALVGGLGNRDDAWYRALHKPAFQPPAAAFPIVWTSLYAGIAAAAAEVLDEAGAADRRRFAAALAGNLALNAAWTWIFFRFRRPGLATVESAALALSTADLARRAGATSARARNLLLPYAGWTAFATVLSGRIARLNR